MGKFTITKTPFSGFYVAETDTFLDHREDYLLVEDRVADGLVSDIVLKRGVYESPVYEDMAFCEDDRKLKEVLGNGS